MIFCIKKGQFSKRIKKALWGHTLIKGKNFNLRYYLYLLNKEYYNRKRKGLKYEEKRQFVYNKRLTKYGQSLLSRKKLCNFYCLKLKQFKALCEIAENTNKNNFTNNLISLLERRLVTVVYRMNFVFSMLDAFNKVKSGYFLVNKKIILDTNYIIEIGDIVEVNNIYKINIYNNLLTRCNKFFRIKKNKTFFHRAKIIKIRFGRNWRSLKSKINRLYQYQNIKYKIKDKKFNYKKKKIFSKIKFLWKNELVIKTENNILLKNKYINKPFLRYTFKKYSLFLYRHDRGRFLSKISKSRINKKYRKERKVKHLITLKKMKIESDKKKFKMQRLLFKNNVRENYFYNKYNVVKKINKNNFKVNKNTNIKKIKNIIFNDKNLIYKNHKFNKLSKGKTYYIEEFVNPSDYKKNRFNNRNQGKNYYIDEYIINYRSNKNKYRNRFFSNINYKKKFIIPYSLIKLIKNLKKKKSIKNNIITIKKKNRYITDVEWLKYTRMKRFLRRCHRRRRARLSLGFDRRPKRLYKLKHNYRIYDLFKNYAIKLFYLKVRIKFLIYKIYLYNKYVLKNPIYKSFTLFIMFKRSFLYRILFNRILKELKMEWKLKLFYFFNITNFFGYRQVRNFKSKFNKRFKRRIVNILLYKHQYLLSLMDSKKRNLTWLKKDIVPYTVGYIYPPYGSKQKKSLTTTYKKKRYLLHLKLKSKYWIINNYPKYMCVNYVLLMGCLIKSPEIIDVFYVFRKRFFKKKKSYKKDNKRDKIKFRVLRMKYCKKKIYNIRLLSLKKNKNQYILKMKKIMSKKKDFNKKIYEENIHNYFDKKKVVYQNTNVLNKNLLNNNYLKYRLIKSKLIKNLLKREKVFTGAGYFNRRF